MIEPNPPARNQPLREFVLPIAEFEDRGGELAYTRLLGTGFLAGTKNTLLTAAHVVPRAKAVCALWAAPSYGWLAFMFSPLGTHPIEDVAAYVVQTDHILPTPFRVSNTWQNAPMQYRIWGYPEDVLYEGEQRDQLGRVLQRPDLVYTQGYIRRRLTMPVGLRGRSSYELSDPAGSGCSGAPVIGAVGEIWWVHGIYVGEMTSEQSGRPTRERGYATRSDAFADWLAKMDESAVLGCLDEGMPDKAEDIGKINVAGVRPD